MSLSDKTKKWLKCNTDISLKGKTAVVTGANSGIGYKTAETLLYLGADVILACRNSEKAEKAKNTLAAEYTKSNVSVMQLDIADFSSINSFSAEIDEKGVDIDIFVNNAGVFRHPGEKTKDGFELVIGTNYLGVYYLTEKLFPYLSALPHEVTYINTVSLIHKFATVEYNDFYYSKKYNSLSAYARSKLCLAKYSYYKAKEYNGKNLKIFMNHPGIALTPLGLNAVSHSIAKLQKVFGRVFNSAEKSSLSVAFILSHKLPVGSIIGPDKFFGGWGYPKINRISRKVKSGGEELINFTEKELKNF